MISYHMSTVQYYAISYVILNYGTTVIKKLLVQFLIYIEYKYYVILNKFVFSSCCSYCCSTDNCNNVQATSSNGMCGGASAVTLKLWMMMVATLLALTTACLMN